MHVRKGWRTHADKYKNKNKEHERFKTFVRCVGTQSCFVVHLRHCSCIFRKYTTGMVLSVVHASSESGNLNGKKEQKRTGK